MGSRIHTGSTVLVHHGVAPSERNHALSSKVSQLHRWKATWERPGPPRRRCILNSPGRLCGCAISFGRGQKNPHEVLLRFSAREDALALPLHASFQTSSSSCSLQTLCLTLRLVQVGIRWFADVIGHNNGNMSDSPMAPRRYKVCNRIN